MDIQYRMPLNWARRGKMAVQWPTKLFLYIYICWNEANLLPSRMYNSELYEVCFLLTQINCHEFFQDIPE